MYYHGTNINIQFNELIPNELGIIWFASKEAAKKYANKYYNKGHSRIFHCELHGKILDFRDKNNDLIRQFIIDIKSSYLFDIEKNWESIAAFDILERNYFFIEQCKIYGYSGIKLLDSTYSFDHESIAYFNDDFSIIDIESI